jgi:tetratricopeptide (TPR) repeat protein
MVNPRTPNLRNTIVFLTFALLFSGYIHGQTAEEYMVEAKRARASFDYSGSLKLMGKAIKEKPDSIGIRIERGNLNLLVERFKDAKEDFDHILSLDSMNVHAWVGMADFHRNVSQMDTAMKNAELAQILAYDDKTLARAKIAVADVHLAEGRDSTALSIFVVSLEIDSTNVPALKKTARLLVENERYDEANSYLLTAYTYDRFDLEIMVNLAYTFNKLKFFSDAVYYCNLALEFDPQHPLTLSNRAYAFMNMGMDEEALDDIKKSLANDGSNPLAYKYAGEIYLALKEDSKACKSFKKAKKFGYDDLYGDELSAIIERDCN